MSSVLICVALFAVFLATVYLYMKEAFQYWKRRGTPWIPRSHLVIFEKCSCNRGLCFATSLLAAVAFGIDVNAIEKPNEEFSFFGRRFFELTWWNMLRLNLTFAYPSIVKKLRLRFADADVCNFIIDTVRQNMDYRYKNNVLRKDFFQTLMDLRNSNIEAPMSVDEMSAHALIFFVAGFESSAATMSYCMYELAKKPETQEKAFQEIISVLQKHDGKLTYESVGEMKYVDNCIDEALRLHPAFSTIARKYTKDYEIADLGVKITEGTTIIVPIAAIQRDGKYYDQPHDFVPERFDEKNKADKTFVDMPYLPFGDGPRICGGLRLAKLEANIGIILLLQKFSFELGPQHINKELVSMPASVAKLRIGGINLRVNARPEIY